MSQVHLEYCDSSSAAMAKVQAEASPHAAALGSAADGELFGLEPIASHLANQQDNITRFIVVTRKAIEVAPDPSKTARSSPPARKPMLRLTEACWYATTASIMMNWIEIYIQF